MGPTLAATEVPVSAAEPRVTRLLGERLELVEELWQTVLRSECPPHQAERLLRMKELSAGIEGGEPDSSSEAATAAIASARSISRISCT
ncbi:MAG: hypothetical protein ACKOE9_07460, partial [Vulcanococcus sp.]